MALASRGRMRRVGGAQAGNRYFERGHAAAAAAQGCSGLADRAGPGRAASARLRRVLATLRVSGRLQVAVMPAIRCPTGGIRAGGLQRAGGWPGGSRNEAAAGFSSLAAALSWAPARADGGAAGVWVAGRAWLGLCAARRRLLAAGWSGAWHCARNRAPVRVTSPCVALATY